MSAANSNVIHPLTEISPIEDIIFDLQHGKMVVLMESDESDNSGVLVMAADHVSAEAINFMVTHGRGLICLGLTEKRCQQLGLGLMVGHNTALRTPFTVSIEAAEGVTTGISTADRARTIQAAVAANACPEDIVRPGHIFPIMASDGGVLTRASHTEAACDLAALAGGEAAAVMCDIMTDEGEVARLPALRKFARQHGLKVGTIANVIQYRQKNDTWLLRGEQQQLNTIYGEFTLINYRDLALQQQHLALVCGQINTDESVLVRVHSPFNPMNLLDNQRHGHSWSVVEAMQYIQQAGRGVLVLLRGDELQWQQQRQGAQYYENEFVIRQYGAGARILCDLGVSNMQLMTWPRRLPSMRGFGLVVEHYVLPDEAINYYAEQ